MPLLRNGTIHPDEPWIRLADDEALLHPDNSEAQPLLVSMPRFLNLDSEDSKAVSGVWIQPADDVAELKSYLDRIQLLAIEFPAFTDGRGYSHARALRKQWNFSGEIRAFGDIRLDQLLFMMRAGIYAFEFSQMPDADRVAQALSRYHKNYQPSYELPVAG